MLKTIERKTMAYKQKGFPTHMSTIQKSPAKQWDWYDENVADQGY